MELHITTVWLLLLEEKLLVNLLMIYYDWIKIKTKLTKVESTNSAGTDEFS